MAASFSSGTGVCAECVLVNPTGSGGDYRVNAGEQAGRVNSGLPADDELLVMRCREGDAQALDALLGRWQERLWRHAWRQTRDEAAAWDILQETCLAIARGIVKLEACAAFGSWAYRIAGHKARDWMRQHARRRQRELDFTERWLLDQTPPGAASSVGGRVREVLARLVAEDRALLLLHYENDLDLEEIAGLLEIPAGTVKSRLHHARQRLRALMEKQP